MCSHARALVLPLLTSLAPLAGVLIQASTAAQPAAVQPAFAQTYVDLGYGGNGRPGWVQAGDIDGDGDLDIVAGGGLAIFVYENAGNAAKWVRHGTLDGTKAIGANGGVLLDVDGDKDLDVVCAKYRKELGWWENPGGKLRTVAWKYHRLHPGFNGGYLHDMILADLDEDGRAREVIANLTSSGSVQLYWFRPGKDPLKLWDVHRIQASRRERNNCHAGLGLGDIDRDGNVDVSYSEGWYEAPDDPTGAWTWHPETSSIYGISNSQPADVDGDGDLDLLVSAGHHSKGVFWLEAPTNPQTGTWTKHAIDAGVTNPEGLQVADLDRDGDLDVLACELFFDRWNKQQHNLYVFERLGGAKPTWKKHNIAPNSYPSHLPYLVDLDRDGRLDIISEATGYSVISFYRNVTKGVPPAVVINEILVDNVNGDRDEKGERDDWIEVHNKSPGPYDLSGHYLTNDPGKPKLWKFPGGVVVPGDGFVRVWADAQPGQGALHASFTLANQGGSVRLSDRDTRASALLDDISYGKQVGDRSFGRVPDGGSLLFHLWEPSGGKKLFSSSPFQRYAVRATGSAQGLSLTGTGGTKASQIVVLRIASGKPNASAALMFSLGLGRVDLGQLGMLALDPVGSLLLFPVLDASGAFRLPLRVPAGLAGYRVYFQAAQADLSNALMVELR